MRSNTSRTQATSSSSSSGPSRDGLSSALRGRLAAITPPPQPQRLAPQPTRATAAATARRQSVGVGSNYVASAASAQRGPQASTEDVLAKRRTEIEDRLRELREQRGAGATTGAGGNTKEATDLTSAAETTEVVSTNQLPTVVLPPAQQRFYDDTAETLFFDTRTREWRVLPSQSVEASEGEEGGRTQTTENEDLFRVELGDSVIVADKEKDVEEMEKRLIMYHSALQKVANGDTLPHASPPNSEASSAVKTFARMFRSDPIRTVYVGETGKVVKIFSHFSVDAFSMTMPAGMLVEFADGSVKFFSGTHLTPQGAPPPPTQPPAKRGGPSDKSVALKTGGGGPTSSVTNQTSTVPVDPIMAIVEARMKALEARQRATREQTSDKVVQQQAQEELGTVPQGVAGLVGLSTFARKRDKKPPQRLGEAPSNAAVLMVNEENAINTTAKTKECLSSNNIDDSTTRTTTTTARSVVEEATKTPRSVAQRHQQQPEVGEAGQPSKSPRVSRLALNKVASYSSLPNATPRGPTARPHYYQRSSSSHDSSSSPVMSSARGFIGGGDGGGTIAIALSPDGVVPSKVLATPRRGTSSLMGKSVSARRRSAFGNELNADKGTYLPPSVVGGEVEESVETAMSSAGTAEYTNNFNDTINTQIGRDEFSSPSGNGGGEEGEENEADADRALNNTASSFYNFGSRRRRSSVDAFSLYPSGAAGQSQASSTTQSNACGGLELRAEGPNRHRESLADSSLTHQPHGQEPLRRESTVWLRSDSAYHPYHPANNAMHVFTRRSVSMSSGGAGEEVTASMRSIVGVEGRGKSIIEEHSAFCASTADGGLEHHFAYEGEGYGAVPNPEAEAERLRRQAEEEMALLLMLEAEEQEEVKGRDNKVSTAEPSNNNNDNNTCTNNTTCITTRQSSSPQPVEEDYSEEEETAEVRYNDPEHSSEGITNLRSQEKVAVDEEDDASETEVTVEANTNTEVGMGLLINLREASPEISEVHVTMIIAEKEEEEGQKETLTTETASRDEEETADLPLPTPAPAVDDGAIAKARSEEPDAAKEARLEQQLEDEAATLRMLEEDFPSAEEPSDESSEKQDEAAEEKTADTYFSTTSKSSSTPVKVVTIPSLSGADLTQRYATKQEGSCNEVKKESMNAHGSAKNSREAVEGEGEGEKGGLSGRDVLLSNTLKSEISSISAHSPSSPFGATAPRLHTPSLRLGRRNSRGVGERSMMAMADDEHRLFASPVAVGKHYPQTEASHIAAEALLLPTDGGDGTRKVLALEGEERHNENPLKKKVQVGTDLEYGATAAAESAIVTPVAIEAIEAAHDDCLSPSSPLPESALQHLSSLMLGKGKGEMEPTAGTLSASNASSPSADNVKNTIECSNSKKVDESSLQPPHPDAGTHVAAPCPLQVQSLVSESGSSPKKATPQTPTLLYAGDDSAVSADVHNAPQRQTSSSALLSTLSTPRIPHTPGRGRITNVIQFAVAQHTVLKEQQQLGRKESQLSQMMITTSRSAASVGSVVSAAHCSEGEEGKSELAPVVPTVAPLPQQQEADEQINSPTKQQEPSVSRVGEEWSDDANINPLIQSYIPLRGKGPIALNGQRGRNGYVPTVTPYTAKLTRSQHISSIPVSAPSGYKSRFL